MLRGEGLKKEYLRAQKSTNILTAVEETDITLEDGAFVVLQGRSGSGKTTLLNMLAGLLQPTAGKVLFREPDMKPGDNGTEYDLYALDDGTLSRLRNRHFGYIPQGASPVMTLSLYENVILPFTIYNDPVTEEDAAYIRELLLRLSIDHLSNEKPRALSGGELRRMAIVRALVRRPAVVFADEPTGDLDDEMTRTVFELFRETAKTGTSVLMVTHETSAPSFADRTLRMNAGKIQGETV